MSQRGDAGVLLDLASAILRFVVKCTPADRIVDLVDEGRNVRERFRAIAPQTSDGSIAHAVRGRLGPMIATEFRGADSGDVTAATIAVQSVIEKYDTTDLILDAVANPQDLKDRLLESGGSALRRDLGNAEAQELFDFILEASLHFAVTIASETPGLGAAAGFTALREGRHVTARVEMLERSAAEILRTVRSLVETAASEPSSISTRGERESIEALVRGYHASVRALLPEEYCDLEPGAARSAHDRLGRATELSAVLDFSLAEDGKWWWWRAGPWTGKTTLMAMLATDPPPGTRTACFFVIGRDDTANDPTRFYAQILPQLALLAGLDTLEVPGDPSHIRNVFHDLLSKAADVSKDAGCRLLLIVDGLDEDAALATESLSHQHGSIAGALPRRLPENVTAIVASRPNPHLADDVAFDHPLREPANWHELSPSAAAEAARKGAEADLRELIRGKLGRNVAATIAAAGAPLTSVDLSEILAVSYIDVERLIEGSRPGRVLVPIPSLLGDKPASGYRLGHEKLDEQLVNCLAPRAQGMIPGSASWEHARSEALAPWRRQVEQWAAGWVAKGWPEESPAYLLDEAYPALIQQDRSRAHELVALLTDEKRVARLYRWQQADHMALRQIRTATTWLLEGPKSELGLLGRLLMTQERLSARNDATPYDVLQLLVLTGQTQRAVRIAEGMSEAMPRAYALRAVSDICTEMGEAHHVSDINDRIIRTLAEVGDRGEALPGGPATGLDADSIRVTGPNIVEVLHRPTSCLPDPTGQRLFNRQLNAAAALLEAGKVTAAQADLQTAWNHRRRHAAWELDLERFGLLAAKASLRVETDILWRDLADLGALELPNPEALRLVGGLIAGGDSATADAIASGILRSALAIPDASRRLRTLARVGAGLALAGDVKAATVACEAALEQVTEKRNLGSAIKDGFTRASVWGEVIEAVSASGRVGEASILAGTLLEPAEKSRALVAVFRGAVEVNHAAIEEIEDPHCAAEAISVLARRATNARQVDELGKRIVLLQDYEAQVRALAVLTEAALRVDSGPRAEEFANQAQAVASRCSSPSSIQRATAYAVGALACAGKTATVDAIIGRLGSQHGKAMAFAHAAMALGRRADREGALTYAERARANVRDLHREGDRVDVQLRIATAMAASGHLGEACNVIDEISSSIDKLKAIHAASMEIPASGEWVSCVVARVGALAVNEIDSYERSSWLISIAQLFSRRGFSRECEILIEAAMNDGPRLSASQHGVLVAKSADVVRQFDAESSRTLIARGWVDSGCPWLGWSSLVHLDQEAMRDLCDALLAEVRDREKSVPIERSTAGHRIAAPAL